MLIKIAIDLLITDWNKAYLIKSSDATFQEEVDYLFHLQVNNFGIGMRVRITIWIVASDILIESRKDLTPRT